MRIALVTAALVTLAAPSFAADDDPYPFAAVLKAANKHDEANEVTNLPEYFPSLGTPHRVWEVRSDTGFGVLRAFTQRFELAHFIKLTHLFGLVLRTTFGFEDTTTASNAYSIQGLIPAIGLRDRSPNDSHWLEFGVRVVPSYPGTLNNDPRMIQLALNAALSSGVADDASWLPFSTFGWQLYGLFQTRTNPMPCVLGTWLLGLSAGGEASLTPMSVSTWLGPQTGFIGNVYMEVFATLARITKERSANLQIGLHGEASLSSIWSATDALPVHANVYIGWSPTPWLSARAFGGIGAVPLASMTAVSFGARLQFYVPDNERARKLKKR